MAEHGPSTGPDFTRGVPESDLADGIPLAGQVDGESVLLVRQGDRCFAIGGACTHYGGPLAEGLVVGRTVRCPWHHARFSLETGEALGAPALNDVPVYEVVPRDGTVFVKDKRDARSPPRVPRAAPESIVILGAGAAGHAAAEQVRRQGYRGPVTLIDPDADEPYDKPNLSKDYLAGNAPEEWIPLRPKSFFGEHDINFITGRSALTLDPAAKKVTFDDGTTRTYDRLLIATGARPVPLPMPVDPTARVHYLRTLADSRGIVGAAGRGRRAVVIGASFIGLEVAASLRAREVEVVVVAPEPIPLERVMGKALGEFVRTVHEEHGVGFRLGASVARVAADAVLLTDGTRLPADFIVAGIGVRPRDELAKSAGLRVDNGIVVDEHLKTSATDVYAAGDVARFPDQRTGRHIRIEHWVVAQRMGQCAARNLLGANQAFRDPPFFWSQHYDAVIAYVGHAAEWDEIELEGRPGDRDCEARFRKDGKVLAVATIFRDRVSLEAEVAMERASG
ncbi:MAG TPA: FAD-dependent oxidoreductase [Gemmatimonadales bacterium]